MAVTTRSSSKKAQTAVRCPRKGLHRRSPSLSFPHRDCMIEIQENVPEGCSECQRVSNPNELNQLFKEAHMKPPLSVPAQRYWSKNRARSIRLEKAAKTLVTFSPHDCETLAVAETMLRIQDIDAAFILCSLKHPPFS